MTDYSSITNRQGTRLKETFFRAHKSCFLIHDILLQLLVSGLQSSIFNISIPLKDDTERDDLEGCNDIFDWLESTDRVDDRANLLITTVFPAILGDMLNCLYETLETSRKGKTTVSFMLLRKPIQESLFVLEYMIADKLDFSMKMTYDSIKLYSQKAGGLEVHKARIGTVLEIIGETDRFDAQYLAQLRYSKSSEDSFDGVCNKAMHLFTSSPYIRTDNLNVNFIFSNEESIRTHWSYIYSRLPYMLSYLHSVVEYICADISVTTTLYVDDMNRRISAAILLWWDSVDRAYGNPELQKFVSHTRNRLFASCKMSGFRHPTRRDLARMAENGAYPGESEDKVEQRHEQFVLLAQTAKAWS